MARFGLTGLLPATRIAARFKTEEAQGIVAGASAHSMLSLSSPLSSAFGLLFVAVAHALGWPVVAGGSQRIVRALCAELESLGGRIHTGTWVRDLGDLPESKAVLLDITPRQFLDLAGDRLEPARRRAARAVPLWAGGLQGRLGAVGAGPLGGRGVPGGRDRARLRALRGGRRAARRT